MKNDEVMARYLARLLFQKRKAHVLYLTGIIWGVVPLAGYFDAQEYSVQQEYGWDCLKDMAGCW